MSCCPSDSLSAFFDGDYTAVGTKISDNGAEFYATGRVGSSLGLIIVPDIFGWDSGRTRRIADMLGASLDAYVVVPKLLSSPAFEGGTDGDALPPTYDLGTRKEYVEWLKAFDWETKIKPNTDKVMDHLVSKGCTKIGGMGFCWGGWCLSHIAAERPELLVGVIPHPSITLEAGLHGGVVADLIQKVKIPMLLLPAGNDPDTYLPGGEILTILTANNAASSSVPFPDMTHGFVSRGDVSVEAVRRDVHKAFSLAEAFLKAHLLQ